MGDYRVASTLAGVDSGKSEARHNLGKNIRPTSKCHMFCVCPLQVGQSVTATVKVLRVSGRRVTFATTAVLQDNGVVVVDGEAMAMLPDRTVAGPSVIRQE